MQIISPLVKYATYQKVQSLRAAFLSKLDNTKNDNPIFNTKCTDFSIKWSVVFHFHNPACSHSHPYNLHQKSKPLLQLLFTSLFLPYLFIKSSLQSPLTLPSSILQQFSTSLFSRTVIPTIYIKSIFPTSDIQPIQTVSRDQLERESCEDSHYFDLSLLPQSIDRDNRAHSH